MKKTLVSPKRGEPSSAGGQPNIVLLIADDMTYRAVGALHNRRVHTPNLDHLVAGGCGFTHAFHQGSWTPAICIASRTMMHTGLTTFHAESAGDDVPLWPQALTQVGYHTHLIGKWHLSQTNLERAFRTWGPLGPAGMFESSPVNGPAGKIVDVPVYQHSIFPTVHELLGLPISNTVEFPSLVELLHGPSREIYPAVFCRYRDFQRSVRTRRHKLIYYPHVDVVQLFDLQRDPWETTNLNASARHATVRKTLWRTLQQFERELDDPTKV